MLKIPPDHTFLVQILLFVALWFVLKRWWFDPALRIMKERAIRSEGAVAEARAVQGDAELLRKEHAAALEVARGDAERAIQEILRVAEAEQKELIIAAHEEAQRTLAEARSRIAEEVAAGRRELQGQVQGLAREVARVVLGRAV